MAHKETDKQPADSVAAEMLWFDSHAHLQDEVYDKDLQSVLDRAEQVGVRQILLPSSSLDDAKRAVALARSDRRLVCAVGCHPHEAHSFNLDEIEPWQTLIDQKSQTRIVAVGEIGLDYHYDFSPHETQQAVFRRQLEWASHWDLPVIIHNREATLDCLRMLDQAAADGFLRTNPGVFHCFSGSVETAKIVLEMGFYLGFDGPVTFKNARKTIDVVSICPSDRLLIETDSPYLTPEPYRGRRNEPEFLPLIGSRIAQIRGVSVETIASETTQNACRLFEL